MGVQNLADIRSFNDYIRSRLLKRVAGCPREMIHWRPAPARWSVAEHVEHLALAEEVYIHWLSDLVAEGRARELRIPADEPRLVDAVPVLIQMGDEPLTAPPGMLPQGRPLDASLAMLASSRVQINNFYDELAELDTDHLTRPFQTVRLNAAQLMHLVGIHELRHEKHIGVLLEAWWSRGA